MILVLRERSYHDLRVVMFRHCEEVVPKDGVHVRVILCRCQNVALDDTCLRERLSCFFDLFLSTSEGLAPDTDFPDVASYCASATAEFARYRRDVA